MGAFWLQKPYILTAYTSVYKVFEVGENEVTITIRVSEALISELRKLIPVWREIPTTYIVDMLLRERLGEVKRRSDLPDQFSTEKKREP